MIAVALRTEIEEYAARTRRTNPLLAKAADGTLSRSSVGIYLANIEHLIRDTQENLRFASRLAREREESQLAAHYEKCQREEAGHEKWAQNDYRRVSPRAAVATAELVVPAIRSLIARQIEWIEEAPALFLSYILFAEYLITLIGPEWLRMLEERCGIPTSSMTVIATHAEVDQHHVEEALDVIDDLVGDPRKCASMRRVLLETCDFFDRFCDEVTDERRARGVFQADVPRVSAA